MIRVVKMSGGKLFGYDIGNEIDEDEAKNIQNLACDAIPVIIVESLEDLERFDIDPAKVEMI